MITGLVTPNREAVIRLPVRGEDTRADTVDAIIDTGFAGYLTLPTRLVTDLDLTFAGATRAVLADGSEVQLAVFEAVVVWDDQERRVLALATRGSALVGMSLLSGSRVTLDVHAGGLVTVEALG